MGLTGKLSPVQVLTPAQAGLGEIAQLEATTDMFRVWDHQRGGGLGRRAAAGQLADIAELLEQPHPDPLRRRLLGVAARMSIIVGHMCADAGLDGHAARYLDLALDAAREACDGDLGACAVNAIARHVLDPGRPRDAITLLRHARGSLRDVRPSVTALLYTTEAWATARLGDYDEMAPCLEHAAELASGAGNVGPAEVAGVAGACYETLAAVSPDGRAVAADQAARHISTALDLREPYYVRSRVLDLVDVEQPDGDRYEQHVVRMARPVAATVMTDAAGRALLMWRHRHVTDTWGWEIPSGRIERPYPHRAAAGQRPARPTGPVTGR